LPSSWLPNTAIGRLATHEPSIVLDSNRNAGVGVELDGFQDPRARLYLAEVGTDLAGVGGVGFENDVTRPPAHCGSR